MENDIGWRVPAKGVEMGNNIGWCVSTKVVETRSDKGKHMLPFCLGGIHR